VKRAAVRAVLVVGTAIVVPVLVPSSAAACDVGVGYRPEISFGRGGLTGGTCSTGTSLTGALLLFLVAVGVLAALGVVAYRRGEARAAALSGGGPDATLHRYLDSVGGGPPVG
jgi:hypothetical protein